MPEQRKRTRVDMDAFARLFCPGHSHSARTVNISLRGVFLDRAPGVEPGEKCLLEIILDSGLKMRFEVSVRRREATGTGLSFVRMDGKSFAHLRNLVRLHAEDADEVDRELLSPAFEISEESGLETED
ncbi:MAG: PilZ domain-containing protein [Desulfonatronovibrionaceae bacterium]